MTGRNGKLSPGAPNGRGPGQPTKYDPDVARSLCEAIADGESMRKACERMGLVRRTVFLWLRRHEGFADAYREARRVQAEGIADELFDIADDGTNDWEERERKDGSTYVALNAEAVGRSRLRLETRKWYLEKVLPKVYGPAAASINIDARTQTVTVTAETMREVLGDAGATEGVMKRLRDVSGEGDDE